MIYADYWTTANTKWRKWRIHDLDLSHSEWFFRTDKVFLAEWVRASNLPLLLPFSELNYPTLRALLMRDFPNVKSLGSDFELPPGTQIVAPWSLEEKAFVDQTARLVLLHNETITVLPPLDQGLIKGDWYYSNMAGAIELTQPDSNIPAVARVYSLSRLVGRQNMSLSPATSPWRDINGELALRGL